MTQGSQPVGTLEVALAHAARLLGSQPALAAQQANEILAVAPGHPQATLLLGIAHREQGQLDASCETLGALAIAQPRWATAHCEHAVSLGAARRGDAAVAALRRAVALNADLPDAWRALADHLAASGDVTGADAAYARHIKASVKDPRLLAAATALCDNDIARAESLLREHLKQFPTDVAAIRMFAEVAARLGRFGDARVLLERCLELSPSFAGARHNYATVLHRLNHSTAALGEIEKLLAAEPRNPGYRNLQAAILSRLGDYERAIDVYCAVLAEYPQQAKVWMSYGHALKTAGRQAASVDAYNKSIELAPQLGESYWSLANLKTFRFSAAQIGTMQSQLARTELDIENRFHFHFALGKALEDAGDYSGSFEHYAEGNRLRRTLIRYDASENTQFVRRSKALFGAGFFRARAGWGTEACDPIFVVGLPRSGSTLIEQILSSHSLVEGTSELPEVTMIARTLSERKTRQDPSRYPESLAQLSAADVRQLGEQYLRDTRIQRKTAAPLFIDKMPNNWAHIGLIHLMLPNARIIDARRHPLAGCFSAFKQHFARGQHFSYHLEDLGYYYRDYVEYMAHIDDVLPGRVHRVIYERMVEDTAAQVRDLLAYCGLEFEAQCLRFYENERAVRTASSEQVRQPIFRHGVDQWQNYDSNLGPLKLALGSLLPSYPQVPVFDESEGTST